MAKKLFLFLLGLSVLSSFSFVPVNYNNAEEGKSKNWCDVIIYSRCYKKMFIYMDGKYVGKLESYYPATADLECGDKTGINIRLKTGKHKISIRTNGIIHKSKFEIPEGTTCYRNPIDC